jgi:hypothetical protein
MTALRLETSVLHLGSGMSAGCGPTRPSCSRVTGSVVKGTGLEVRMAEETATVSGRVRATFVSGQGARLMKRVALALTVVWG